MLQTIRARECDDARRLLGAALSLVLVFRLLLGPALLTTLGPGSGPGFGSGVVAICGGTTIVYVNLDGDEGEPGELSGDPCPFYGFAAAPPQPGTPVLAPRPAVFAGHAAPAGPVRLEQAGRAGYTPRAPPSIA